MSNTFLLQQPDGSWARLLTNLNGDANTLRVEGYYAIGPGYLDPRFTFSRAHTPSGGALYVTGSDGVTQVAYAQDVVPFQGVGRELLVTPQFTNDITNPRGEGPAPGATNAAATPSGWIVDGGAFGGLTMTLVGRGFEGDLPYVELRFSGTATGNVSLSFIAAAVAAGDVRTAALNWRLSAGSLAGVTATQPRITILGGAGTTFLVGQSPTSASLATQRLIVSPATAGTGATSARPGINLQHTPGATIDYTLQLAGMEMVAGATMFPVATPPIGAPQAQTIGASLLSTNLNQWPSIANGFFVYGTVRFLAPYFVPEVWFEFHDGVGNNRVRLRRDAGDSVSFTRVTGGAVASVGAATGTIIPGTIQPWGMWGDSAGNLKAVVGSSGLLPLTGGAALTAYLNARLTGNVNNGEPAYATFPRVSGILPYYPSDAEALARIAALPLF